MVVREHVQNQQIMLTEWSDSDQTLPLTPVSSFGPLDMVAINAATSTGQPVVTNQVPNQVMTNPNVNATNHSIVNTSTNQGASGCPIHHEWVWFRLEGQSGCSLGPAQTEECQSIALIIHQELGSNAFTDPAAESS